jgi:hypothetical protein
MADRHTGAAVLRAIAAGGAPPAARVEEAVARLKRAVGSGRARAAPEPIHECGAFETERRGAALCCFFSGGPGLFAEELRAAEGVALALVGEARRAGYRAGGAASGRVLAGVGLLRCLGLHRIGQGQDPLAGPIGAALREVGVLGPPCLGKALLRHRAGLVLRELEGRRPRRGPAAEGPRPFWPPPARLPPFPPA